MKKSVLRSTKAENAVISNKSKILQIVGGSRPPSERPQILYNILT